MNDPLRDRLVQLEDALPMLSAERLSMAAEMILVELEAMSPENRFEYGPEIARLISSLETRIFALEQELKPADT